MASQPTETVLGGSVRWQASDGGGYCVSFSLGNKLTKSKYFGSTKFGTKEAALREAENYRRTMSAKLGKTKTVTIPTILRPDVPIPDTVIEYTSGFLDGDGCVSVCKGRCRARASIGFSQSSASGEPEVLRFLQSYYGGNIYHHHRSADNSAHRPSYDMRLPSDCVEPFVRQVLPRCVIKVPQVQLVLDYVTGRIGETVAMEQSKRLHAEYGKQVDLARDRITPAYTAGILDAEGCVMLDNGRVRVSIAQRCPEFLRALQSVYGGSVISPQRDIKFYGPTAVSLLRAVEPFLHVKKEQVRLALAYVDRYPTKSLTKRSVEQMEDCAVATASMKRLKHCT